MQDDKKVAYLVLLFVFLSQILGFTRLQAQIKPQKNHWIAAEMRWLQDLGSQLDPLQAQRSQSWYAITEEVPNFGAYSGTIWAKGYFFNASKESAFLMLNYPQLDSVVLLLYDTNGRLLKTDTSGAFFPKSRRAVPGNKLVFKIPPGHHQVLLKIKGQFNLQLPMQFLSTEDYLQIREKQNFGQGLYFGFILLILLYQLILWLSLKDNLLLYYALHAGTTAIITAHLEGYTYLYLWPDCIWMNRHEPMVFGLGVFSTLFAMKFLNTSSRAPYWHRWLKWSVAINCLVFPISLLGQQAVANQLVQMVGMLGCLLMLIVGIVMAMKKDREAQFFSIALSLFLAGVVITILQRIGLVPYNFFTIHASQIGSGFDLALLSIAIGDRFRRISKDKEALSEQLISSTSVIAQLTQEQNKELAEKVEERTLDLAKSIQAKDRLFSIIGHDLRGPLGASAQLVEMMATEQALREDPQTWEILVKSLNQSSLLLENLLLWARSQKGELEATSQKVQVKALIHPLLEAHAVQLTRKQLRVSLDIQVEVIATDVQMMQAIIRNLLSNAIKFSPEGGTITLAAFIKNNQCQLALSNEGDGILPDRLGNLFEIKSGKSTKGTSGEHGSGLGLVLVKEFINHLGGKIEVESQPGQLTTFRLSLPIAES